MSESYEPTSKRRSPKSAKSDSAQAVSPDVRRRARRSVFITVPTVLAMTVVAVYAIVGLGPAAVCLGMALIVGVWTGFVTLRRYRR